MPNHRPGGPILRESIARWETGAREPSLSTLQRLVEACGLELVLQLSNGDHSFDGLIDDQLKLSPKERVAQLLAPAVSPGVVRALRWLAATRTPVIVIGGIAATLQGAPQQLPSTAVEFVSSDPPATETELRSAGATPLDSEDRWADDDRREPWLLPRGGTVAMAQRVPGSQDYADLRRSAQTLAIDKRTSLQAAHPRDLVRLADASPRESERARAPVLRALLTHTTDRAPNS